MRQLIDKSLVKARFARAIRTYGEGAVVQRRMAHELAGMVLRHAGASRFERLLEVGSGSGLLTRELLGSCSVGSYWANDIVPESRHCLEALFREHPDTRFTFLEGDVESIEALPAGLDLVVSNATLQWLEGLELFFARIARSLRPGGLFCFSTFGPGNMLEIAALEQRSLGYRTEAELVRLAAPAFELLESASRLDELLFASPEAVLRHIRQTGVNALPPAAWGPARHRAFLERYRNAYGVAGGVRLTYHPLWCCMRRLP